MNNELNFNKIKGLIDESGLKRGFIAKKCGVEQYSMSRYVAGKRSPKDDTFWAKLAAVLRVDETLFYQSDD